eukprot:241180_1
MATLPKQVHNLGVFLLRNLFKLFTTGAKMYAKRLTNKSALEDACAQTDTKDQSNNKEHKKLIKCLSNLCASKQSLYFQRLSELCTEPTKLKCKQFLSSLNDAIQSRKSEQTRTFPRSYYHPHRLTLGFTRPYNVPIYISRCITSHCIGLSNHGNRLWVIDFDNTIYPSLYLAKMKKKTNDTESMQALISSIDAFFTNCCSGDYIIILTNASMAYIKDFPRFTDLFAKHGARVISAKDEYQGELPGENCSWKTRTLHRVLDGVHNIRSYTVISIGDVVGDWLAVEENCLSFQIENYSLIKFKEAKETDVKDLINQWDVMCEIFVEKTKRKKKYYIHGINWQQSNTIHGINWSNQTLPPKTKSIQDLAMLKQLLEQNNMIKFTGIKKEQNKVFIVKGIKKEQNKFKGEIFVSEYSNRDTDTQCIINIWKEPYVSRMTPTEETYKMMEFLHRMRFACRKCGMFFRGKELTKIAGRHTKLYHEGPM